ncbi:Plexin-A4 [Liparis tanakae]|uniref:Plexin-A4 n=1 Tax=Liparis tanakae TaxID=230148 RepID=A0A4Z2HH70_9TELE|nr:Plexin-A4 [Liparis tanakae]
MLPLSKSGSTQTSRQEGEGEAGSAATGARSSTSEGSGLFSGERKDSDGGRRAGGWGPEGERPPAGPGGLEGQRPPAGPGGPEGQRPPAGPGGSEGERPPAGPGPPRVRLRFWPKVKPRAPGEAPIVQLYLKSKETGLAFANTSFVFYNCSVHKSCLSCVSSPYQCHWCKYRHDCTHDPRTCSFQEGRVRKPELSPRELSIVLATGSIPVAAELAVITPLRCRGKATDWTGGRDLTKDNNPWSREASCVHGYTGSCGPLDGGWRELNAVFTGTVTTCKKKTTELGLHLYKCDAQRGSCGLCLKADPLFGCVWCKAENRCTLKQHCPHPENQWLEHNGINSKCTHPKITQAEFLQ